ncbi:MAG: phage major capsid protein [Thiohalophilus sp.]|uniref:phage major capsid protein n=1 Tax=Thiohalophilus sp. TaxID=3028392 RepID=UPI00287085E5|nr:phage major capsid protein [Thiohalophilus sp.]MDR9437544.1 phage major capsid protein [Thiohalophilus sp.]
MAFTAQELNNIANAALDYNIRGGALSQTIQERPLLSFLESNKKSFPGGKEAITGPVKGVYTSEAQGYSHDDTVIYKNPANLKRYSVNWYELHCGINVTMTELKNDGISVVDSMNGAETTEHSERELTVLTGLLEDKVEDMNEGWARSFNSMLWQDGTQDSKAVPGLLSFILDDPTAAGSTFGIDRTANTWWRNRASLLINASTASNQNLVNELQKEIRQLRRYGGRPDKFLAGSDFMDALEQELRAKGNYTETGWSKSGGGRIDASVADMAFKGIPIEYDPTLDDLGRAKYGYILDSNHIKLRPMDGEDMKSHNPARPPEKYVIYRAMTWTGGLVCDQLNSCGVYSIS